MRSLGVICARGSSKRLPRKNVKPLLDLPLVQWMARAAKASGMTRAIISTEDAEIAECCRAVGVEAPFVRPEELAADYALSPDIVGHALEFCEQEEGQAYDVLVLLQPTTPFVEPANIDNCLAVLAQNPEVNCCFTARPVLDKPQWMFARDEASGLVQPLLGEAITGMTEHSQFLKPAFIPNGAAYAVRCSALRAQRRIICDPARIEVMSAERSVDVDDLLDWTVAQVTAEHCGFKPF